MNVRPLLRNSSHRGKVTPVRIALEWELSVDWEFDQRFCGLWYANSFLQKTFNLT